MATFSITPGQTYTKANTQATGPCYIELFEPGWIRVVVSNTGVPAADVGTYHLVGYPNGSFSYGGNEALYVRNDDVAGNVKVIVTEIA